MAYLHTQVGTMSYDDSVEFDVIEGGALRITDGDGSSVVVSPHYWVSFGWGGSGGSRPNWDILVPNPEP